MKKNRFKIILVTLILLAFASFIFSLCWGTYKIAPLDVLKVLLGGGEKFQRTAIFTLRLPRIIVGIFVAIALSTAGGILQTITKNDLADTGIIGINAGASVAAVFFISYSTVNYYTELGKLSIYLLPFVAIIGAGISSIFIYVLSSFKGLKPKRLLLIGIGVNAALNAIITIFTFRGGIGEYNRVLVWTSGSLWGTGWDYVKVIVPIVTIMFLLVLANYKKLDVLSLSEELVISLGLNLEKERRKFLVYSFILAGVATAFAGNIAFLGLIAPHLAKKLVGAYHKKFILVSGIISVIIVILADSISRNLFSPLEIPVGITISIFAVPYFIYLIMKEK